MSSKPCSHCLEYTDRTFFDDGVNPVCSDFCETSLDEALEDGEVRECDDCGIFLNADESYSLDGFSSNTLCETCYDETLHHAESQKMRECEVMTRDKHIENYGSDFPGWLDGDAYLYNHDGRLQHHDCFVHECSEDMTLDEAWADFSISTCPVEFQEFIFS